MRMLLLPLLCFGASASASPIPEFPFIYVVGEAARDVPPASARIGFYILEESEDSNEGEENLRISSKRVMTLLLDAGVTNEQIEASSIRKMRNVEDAEDPFEDHGETTTRKTVSYGFTQRFEIEVKDLDSYSALAEKLIGDELIESFSVSFEISDRDTVLRSLRVEAIKDARKQAEEISEASGVKLGNLHAISEAPYASLNRLIGESDDQMFSKVKGRENVYEVPATVSETFMVFVLYKINSDPK